ncbi:U3 small nucleolar ribonucleoprotein subunit [Entamoeba marina]
MNSTQQVTSFLKSLHETPTTVFPTINSEAEFKIRDALKFILNYYGISGVNVDGFTEEQIYYQIEQFNKKNLKNIEKLEKQIDSKIEKMQIKMEEVEEGDKENNELDYLNEDIDMDEMNRVMKEMDNFEMSDESSMEQALEDEENEEDDNEEIEDEGMEESEEDNSEEIKEESNEIEQDSEDSETNNSTSQFGKQQKLVKDKITKLEKENMKEKHWSMLGEVTASERPKDSLVEMEIDYQNTNRPPPQMTKEQTGLLEDMIRRRIKEQSWDDVVRKHYHQNKKRKNKLGLGEIYEQKYAKEIYGFDSKDEALNTQKREIMDCFTLVMKHLDKLTSAYR